MRSVGFTVEAERPSLILLLLRRFREGFASSIGDCGELSPTCMLDLTYRRGTLKNVATGVRGRGGIGGNTRLASILEKNDELADLMNVLRSAVHCPVNRKGGTLNEPQNMLSFFEHIMR
jgi:hypothetical protein